MTSKTCMHASAWQARITNDCIFSDRILIWLACMRIWKNDLLHFHSLRVSLSPCPSLFISLSSPAHAGTPSLSPSLSLSFLSFSKISTFSFLFFRFLSFFPSCPSAFARDVHHVYPSVFSHDLSPFFSPSCSLFLIKGYPILILSPLFLSRHFLALFCFF